MGLGSATFDAIRRPWLQTVTGLGREPEQSIPPRTESPRRTARQRDRRHPTLSA
jgi:hypothetical protein